MELENKLVDNRFLSMTNDLSTLQSVCDGSVGMNDTADVLRACQGDTAAASELLKRTYRPVFAFLRRLCGNECVSCHQSNSLIPKRMLRIEGRFSMLAAFFGPVFEL